LGDNVDDTTPHAKMVKIGPAGPTRQRGEIWRSNAGYFLFFVIFYRISLARLWRPQFCTDRHRFASDDV